MRSPCPAAEELAALLEGRSDPEARKLLLAHLDACDACFQVFTAAAEFRADFPEYALPPPANEDDEPDSG